MFVILVYSVLIVHIVIMFLFFSFIYFQIHFLSHFKKLSSQLSASRVLYAYFCITLLMQIYLTKILKQPFLFFFANETISKLHGPLFYYTLIHFVIKQNKKILPHYSLVVYLLNCVICKNVCFTIVFLLLCYSLCSVSLMLQGRL